MADVLSKVKSALGITGNYQDTTLKIYIDEVKYYMEGAGVPESVINSDISAGVISRGVTDLWSYGTNDGKLSDYFYQRVSQLIYTLQTGKYIILKSGDYGVDYPVNVVGVDIADTDTIIFKCENIEKEYTGITNNCILITFTEEESTSIKSGTYNWTLKIRKDAAVVTAVNDGILIVS